MNPFKESNEIIEEQDTFDYDAQLKLLNYSDEEIANLNQMEKEYIVQEWRRSENLPL